MTDRDHFAAAALTGLLSNVQRYQNEPLTRQAFEIADFMLREREKNRVSQNTAETMRPVTEPIPKVSAGIDGTDHPVPYSRTDEKRVNWPTIRDTTRPRNGTPAEGSVQGEGTEPVAWGLPSANGDWLWGVSLNKEAIERHCPTNQTLAPLYRHPQTTLTDAERDAITGVIAAEHGRGAWAWADTLRGLLERLK